MADRYVRIDIFSKGADQVRKDFDDLDAKAHDLTDKPHDISVDADTKPADARMDALKLKLDMLKKEGGDIPLTLGNDKFNIQILEARAKLDDLSKQAEKPKLGLDTNRFHAEVLKAGLELDRLEAKAKRLKIGEDKGFLKGLVGGLSERVLGRSEGGGGGGILGRLFGGGGGGEGIGGDVASAGGSSIGKDALSSLGGASNYLTGGAIGAAIAAAMSISPAVIPFALGGGAGIGGILAAYLTGHTKGITGLENTGKSTLNWALSSDASKPHGGLAPGTSFLAGLSPIFHQLDGFIKSMGPDLANMFRASLPFISAFAKILEQLATLLMPALTQTMKEMKPYLPQLVQGFALLSEGVADFIKDMGPGMKDSVTVFKAMMDAVKGILIGVAFACDGLAIAFAHVGNWVRNTVTDIHNRWDELRHDTANIFDGIRHDIATIWDDIWSHTIGALIDADHHMLDVEMEWRHSTANIFDGLRHDVASIWDGLWSDVGNRLRDGTENALSTLKDWWHTIDDNFDTLRHTVANTWSTMWNDVKNMTRDAVHGVSDAIHGIEGAFHTPIAFVVNDVWDRLADIWNKIAGIVHLSSLKLPVAHMSEGGRVGGTGTGDHVPAMLEPGERVLSKMQVGALGGHEAIDSLVGRGTGGPFGFSGGGIIGGIGSFLSGLGKDILGWVTKPLSFIIDHMFGSTLDLLGHIPGGNNGITDVLASMTHSLVSNLVKDFKTQGMAGFGGKAVDAGPGLITVAKYIMSHGGTKAAGAGVGGVVAGESGGNPEAIEAGGGGGTGLIQWTPGSSAFPIQPLITGNVRRDMGVQLVDMLAYINSRGGIGALNRSGSPMGAAWAFSGMEAPAVPGSDIRSSVVASLYRQGYANGGWITEPIIGAGLRTGGMYSFGEVGPEYVTPAGRMGGGGDTYNIMVTGDTNPDAAALRIIQEIRRYKKKHGNQATGIG